MDSFKFSPPPGYLDFDDQATADEWDQTMRSVFEDTFWNVRPHQQGSRTPGGVAYRLPDYKQLATSGYDNYSEQSYLQFRRTDQVLAMAEDLSFPKPAEKVITWTGFPKRLNNLPPSQRFAAAENLGWPPSQPEPPFNQRQMDEYCEWYTHKNAEGTITRIDITCEPPEYFQFLHAEKPDTVLDLYRRYVHPDVTADSLLGNDGRYNVYNEWNTDKGAMHLNCPPSSLFAEVFIAAEAATYWGDCIPTPSGPPCKPITDGSALINCGAFGAPSRASDPTIGNDVNSLIRGGNVVSIQNPVALFMEDLNTDGWQNNQRVAFSEEEISQIVTYERVSKGDVKKNLRIRVEIPEAWGYALGDCFISGVPIRYAGQVADASVTVFLVGIAVPGNTFVKEDAGEKAIVPCKSRWATMGRHVPPVERDTPLYPPVSLVSSRKLPKYVFEGGAGRAT